MDSVGTETTVVGAVTLWKRIVKEMRSEHDRGDGHFSTEEVEMVESFVKGLEQPTACTEILMGADGSYECNEPLVRGDKCEQHKVERRRWVNGDRRSRWSSDTPPPCGNAACCSEFTSDGKLETRHDLRCPDRGPGWV